MNLDPLSFSLVRVNQLITGATKDNLKRNTAELLCLVSNHGLEADKQALKKACGSARGGWEGGAVSVLLQRLLAHPARAAALIPALPRSARVPPLSAALETALSLILLHCSQPDLVEQALHRLKRRLPELVKRYLDSEGGGLRDCGPELLQPLLAALSEDLLGLSAATRNEFKERLREDFPRDLVPVILAPLLYSDDTEFPLEEMTEDSVGGAMESSVAELIREIGYTFTSSLEECKMDLVNLGGRELSAEDIARIISMMVRHHAGLGDGSAPAPYWLAGRDKPDAPVRSETWNVDVFIQTVKELYPNLNWQSVIIELDHPEFMVKDRQGLNLLFSILRLGLQSGVGYPANIFPIDAFCCNWKNAEGQISLIANIIKYPDIFCFGDHAHNSHNFVSMEMLKSIPETDNKEISNWRYLKLSELLLNLAERGYYAPVHELFMMGVQHCPDVLLLSLVQNNAKDSMLKHELMTNLIPVFLNNHPNSGAVLSYAWHSQNPNMKTIIMRAMADWYLRGAENDQSRLSRILDVAQDLKALSSLLNAQSFMFVIDLACLASRREYLKLDKWLSDKIREHGESFITSMVKFLQRRCPLVIGGKVLDDQIPKAAQLPHDTIATMLSCLHVYINNVQPDLSELIMAVVTNCSLILNKSRQQVTNLQRPHRVIEAPFNSSAIGSQIFNTNTVDPLATLNTNFGGMNLGAPGNTPFSLTNPLGPLVSTPGSPSRLMTSGPSGSPFTMMPPQHGNLLPNLGMMNRMGSVPQVDKRQEMGAVPEIMQSVSKEIEDEANGYFQRIYNHPPHPTLSIDEVLDMLKKFQDSPNKREREVFSCMLRNLFEEYRFFPQYPEKELYITAQLFGGIIERGLVSSYMALGLALKFVLDALRKQVGSKMYFFGIAALDKFKTKLKEYHKYCEHVRQIEHFYEFPPHLIEYIEYALQGQEPPSKPSGVSYPSVIPNSLLPNTSSVAPTSSMSLYKPPVTTVPSTLSFVKNVTTTHTTSRPSIANATNIDTLLVATDRDEKIIIPPESVQEKCAFIFNNLSQLNLQSKCDELKDIITEEYWPWLSQYLVMKRASIESNFHTLYSNFLDVLKIKEFNEMVTRETFRNIKVLLRSDKGIANFSDRSLLKNLGHWLGMLTLGRNRPILQIDLDLKSLILEAFHKGQEELLYVIPFVAKVLESCDKSKVFKSPNPWTMSIMNVLSELHQLHDLKLNLKFEIEVLCKNLSIDVADLKPGEFLKDAKVIHKHQLSHPNKKDTPIPITQHNITTPTPTNIIASSIVQADDMVGQSVTPTSVLAGETGMVPVVGLPEPRFNYMDVNPSSTQLAQYIVINHGSSFQTNPQLKKFVQLAVERSIQEWIHPVAERSLKFALTTCEQIIRKDFALDPDENRMRQCAHNMVRNLVAGMAMINCRDQLLATITSNLKTSFLSGLITATTQQKDIIETTASRLAADNMELACTILQKSAVEKAIPDIDRKLMNEYEVRKIARQEGRRYYDTGAYTYQNERMPERCRIKVGVVNDAQLAVYEEFARNIPGFAPSKGRDSTLTQPMTKPVIQDSLQTMAAFGQPNAPPMGGYYGNDELGMLINDTEQLLTSLMNMQSPSHQASSTHTLLEMLLVVRRNAEPITAFTLLQKTVEGLLDGVTVIPAGTSSEHAEAMNRYKELHIRALKLLQDTRAFGQAWTSKHVSRCLAECREELRYNLSAVDLLIRSSLVNLPMYDLTLAQFMDNGNNYMAVAFAMQLVQLYLVDEREMSILTEADLYNTIEAFVRILSHSRQPPPEGLTNLVEMLRVNRDTSNNLNDRSIIGPTSFVHSGMMSVRAREMDDPPGLLEKTEYLLREWISLYHNPPTNTEPGKTFNLFVQQMNHQGILKSDDLISRFFRIATRLCIENIYSMLEEERQNNTESGNRNKFYHMTDAYVRLVALLIKNSGESGSVTPKINLLCKVLGITAGWLLQDHDDHGTGFQQLPYMRIFLILFLELNQPEPVLESMNFQVLKAFCHSLHMVRPSLAPAFTYAWIDLISHRAFISRMLAVTPQQKGWLMYSQLMVHLFKFMAPFLRNTELAKPITLAYKGILKVLLVLLHDFPEFLCDYHYVFCDEIPPNCIQMRNLILSAFPRNMRLPDPFTPNLKVDLLGEITQSPRVMANVVQNIQPPTFKKDLDSYLKARAPVAFLSELRGIMQISNDPGKKYNIQLINAVVLYVGTQAIAYIRSKGQNPNMSSIAHSSHMDIFQNLAVDLDHEGRYIFLNAIANQLRYPNSHTHYFSCTLLYLFAEANTEAIQEQITRMLLERLIVNRPHPWGLLITFIELIKNSNYKFWEHDFVHCAPEIEKLFESVARSCLVEKTPTKQEIELVE